MVHRRKIKTSAADSPLMSFFTRSASCFGTRRRSFWRSSGTTCHGPIYAVKNRRRRTWNQALQVLSEAPRQSEEIAAENFNSEFIMQYPSPLLPLGRKRSRGKPTFFFKVMLVLTAHVVVIGGLLLQGCKETKQTVANQPLADVGLVPVVPSIATIQPLANTNGFAKVAIVSPTHISTQKAAAASDVAVAESIAKVYKVQPGDTLVKIARTHHTTYRKIMVLNDLKSSNVKPGQMLQLPATNAPDAPATAMN